MKHYLRCKSRAPHNTSACIAVPAFHSAKWRSLLQDMRLLKQYAKGAMLFAEAGHGSIQVLGPSPWDYEVHYDPPVAGPVELSRRQVRWQEFLSRFDFKWEYRKGSANVADPISRCSTLMCTLMSMLAEWAPAGDDSVPGGLLRQIINGYASDEWFANEKNTAALTFSDGVQCRGSQIAVPDADDLRQKCLSVHHDTPFAGHLGRVIALCSWCCKPTGGLVLSVMCGSMCRPVITATAI